MIEFLMEVLKAASIAASLLLGLACIGYAIAYGFYNGKADSGGNKYRLILPEVNVIHKQEAYKEKSKVDG